MVKFPGTKMQLLIFIFLSLIMIVSNRPQNYDENLHWRSQPRSIDNNGRYSNQRLYYNQPAEQQYTGAHLSQSVNPSYYDSYVYHRPRTQPGPSSHLRSISRGPQKDILPVTNTKPYEPSEYNSTYDMSAVSNNQPAPVERVDRRFDATNKKETTRILNSPPDQRPKPVSTNGETVVGDQNDFVFPGNPILQSSMSTSTTRSVTNNHDSNQFIPDVAVINSICSPDDTFCLYTGSYPTNYIKNTLKKSAQKYNDLFGRDEIANNVSISTRIDLTLDGTPMCASKEQIIEPSVAKNKNNEWKYIVQGGSYVQGIRIEICENEGKECAMSGSFPIGYKTECKQKYIYRKLLALESSGEFEPDNFRMPSCCTCIYKQNLDFKPGFRTSARRK